MARDIRVTNNFNSTTTGALPKIEFKGKDAETITLYVDDDGVVRFSDASSDLLTISEVGPDGLLFSVNDTSGFPVVEAYDTGKVTMGIPFDNNLVIDNTTGNVGIGTASPASTLTVDGTLGIYSGTSSVLYAASNVGINTTSPTQTLDVDGNGRFRNIGSDASAGALHYASDGTLTVNTSDETLKENIETISNSLDLVNALDGKYFNWKDTGEKSIGLIAQEVEKIVPELSFTNPNTDLMGVHYDKVVALLINAVKVLSDEVKKLKGE